jgi:flagellin
MAISIVTNIASLNAQRNLQSTTDALAQNVSRLSSGLRLNQASDDAAGTGISANLSADVRSLSQASRNANDAISMGQLAEGALGEITSIVTRMRELAVQSSNATIDSTARSFINKEFSQLRSEINRISMVTEFNGQTLLSGSLSAGVDFQIGINSSADNRIALSVGRTHSSTLGIAGGSMITSASLSTATNAQIALSIFDAAITNLSTTRANIGAVQNRLSATLSNLSVARENLSAANSRIKDVDVAEESAALTRNQILSQAGTALLSQANQLPQAALSLIK